MLERQGRRRRRVDRHERPWLLRATRQQRIQPAAPRVLQRQGRRWRRTGGPQGPGLLESAGRRRTQLSSSATTAAASTARRGQGTPAQRAVRHCGRRRRRLPRLCPDGEDQRAEPARKPLLASGPSRAVGTSCGPTDTSLGLRRTGSTHVHVFSTPQWATGSSNASVPPPNHRASRAWKKFLKHAVRRYGPHGSFWKENPGATEDAGSVVADLE